VPAENFTDLAANVYGQGSPSPFASYTWQYDSTANATDGQIIYDDSPLDSRWTDYGSPKRPTISASTSGPSCPSARCGSIPTTTPRTAAT